MIQHEDIIIQKVVHSWCQVKALKKLGFADFGVLLFKKMFTESPKTLELFSFQFEHDLYNSAPLRHHCNLVIKAFDKAIAHIRNMDELNPYLDELGKTHADVKRGIKPSDFDLMQRNLIEVLRETLEDDFTPEVEQAWNLLTKKFFKAVKDGTVIEEIQLQSSARDAEEKKHEHSHHHDHHK